MDEMTALEPCPRAKRLRSSSSYEKWVVVWASCFANFCLLGVMRSSFSVIFVALLDNFHLTREDAAWSMGIYNFCGSIAGVIAGYLTHYWSNRTIMIAGVLLAFLAVELTACATSIQQINVLFGACHGIGIGFSAPLLLVTVNQYFSNNRALATGISYSGSSIGAFLLPLLFDWMLGEYGLYGTFMLIGGILLNSLPAIALMRAPRQDFQNMQLVMATEEGKLDMENIAPNAADDLRENLNVTEDTKPHTTDSILETLRNGLNRTVNLLTNVDFLVISVANTISTFTYFAYLTVILDFAKEKGFSSKLGVYFASVYGFGDMAGRLACGWLGDLKCVNRSITVSCYMIVMGAIVLLLPWCYSYALMTSVSLLVGVLAGAILVNIVPLLVESMGSALLPLTNAYATFLLGVTSLLRPVVIGIFRDHLQSYDLMFISLGVGQILMTIPLIIKDFIQRAARDHAYERMEDE